MMSAAMTPTDGRRADAEALGLLDHLPAGGDLQPGDVDLVDRVEHRLAVVVGQQVRALVVVDGRERGLAVLGDLDRPGGAVRADDADDVRHRRPPCASSGSIASRTAGRRPCPWRVEDDRVDVAALGLELALSRSMTCWDSVPGRLKLVAYWRPTAAGDHGRSDRDHDPPHDHPPSMGDAPATQTDHRDSSVGRKPRTLRTYKLRVAAL